MRLDEQEVVASTRRNNVSALNQHWMPASARIPLNEITPALLREVAVSTTWGTPSIKRNSTILLRTVSNTAAGGGRAGLQPGQGDQVPRPPS